MQLNNNTIKGWVPFILLGGIGLGFLLSSFLFNGYQKNVAQENKIAEVLQLVQSNYVDPIDSDSLNDQVIAEVLSNLDPHSIYIDPATLLRVQEDMEGTFNGIGVEFLMAHDTVLITHVKKDGPSQAAGIQVGSQIISVNDSVVAGQGLDSEDIIKLLRGEEDSQLKLCVLPKRSKKLFCTQLKRKALVLPSVPPPVVIKPGVVYVKIEQFGEHTSEEFVKQIGKIYPNGKLDQLILDLRDNPGGLIESAILLLDNLIPEKDKLLTYTIGKNNSRQEYKTKGRSMLNIHKIAVLINENSASAAEIVSGALQDWDKATVIGRRSFGKGLVQDQYEMKDGSAIRLTVARYYLPSGRLIQKSYVDKLAYDLELDTRFQEGELFHEAVQDTNNQEIFKTASGRKVYGGGGIQPDVFVPFDSNRSTRRMDTLMREISPFLFQLNDLEFTSIPKDSSQFIYQYQIPESMYQNYLNYIKIRTGKHPNLSYSEKQLVISTIKYQLGRIVCSENIALRVSLENDKEVQKAISVLKTK